MYATLGTYYSSGALAGARLPGPEGPLPKATKRNEYVIPQYGTSGYASLSAASTAVPPSNGYYTLQNAYGTCSNAFQTASC